MADELERALLLRDLELMGQPRNPNAVQPGRAGLLDLGVGLPERLSLLNQIFNPVEAIGQSMNAGERMMSPNMGVMDRVAALGDMLSGVAGVTGPAVVAGRAGVPAAAAVMEGLLGGSPTQQAASDMARQFAADESGALRLYHGSPHDFDRFSMSKIGTGEGAQAYGHGLYFAENEGIARSYRDTLSPSVVAVDGRVVDSPTTRLAASFSPNPDDYIKALTVQRERAVRNLESSASDPELGDIMSDLYKTEIADIDAKIAELKPLSGGWFHSASGGRMYEVNVNANPEDFINFDAPFEQQPPNVQKHFGYLARGERKPTGEDLARRMESNVYIQEAAQAGIPGIRYLDAGSRYTLDNLPDNIITREARQFLDQAGGDPDKALSLFNQSNPVERWAQSERNEVAKVIASAKKTATRNYVVFDENLINIVRKYGIAGAAAMLGMSQADVAQAMQQQQQKPQGLLSGAQ